MVTILQDSREQALLQIDKYPVELAGGDNWEEEGRGPCLPVGDYGIKGFSHWDNPAFIVERKSLSDLCSSFGTGHDAEMRKIEKMRQFRFRALVIEASRETAARDEYRSEIAWASLRETLAALEVRANVHVYWCGSPDGAARVVESLADQFVKGIEKDAARVYGVSRAILRRLVKKHNAQKEHKALAKAAKEESDEKD